MASQENNVPSFTFTKKLGVGKFQLVKAGTYTDNQTFPATAASITLGTIATDKTATFTDGTSEDDGVLMIVHNKNAGAGAWLVAGNVKESSTLDDITELGTGVHQFIWDEADGYWARLSTTTDTPPSGGGASGTLD